MRSYTETVWAKLMDEVGIQYLYEPDLVQVQGGMYLPDFRLLLTGVYLEVKGDYPTDDEKRKASDVIDRTGKHVIFLIGKPESDSQGFCNCLLMMRGNVGWFQISLYELGTLYRAAAGMRAWGMALLSVSPSDSADVVHISQVVEEYFFSLMERSGRESAMRDTHKPLNQAKIDSPKPESIAEQGIAWAMDRWKPAPQDQTRSSAQ